MTLSFPAQVCLRSGQRCLPTRVIAAGLELQHQFRLAQLAPQQKQHRIGRIVDALQLARALGLDEIDRGQLAPEMRQLAEVNAVAQQRVQVLLVDKPCGRLASSGNGFRDEHVGSMTFVRIARTLSLGAALRL